ncbi:nucleotide sugar dehydrogenase [Bacillus cereus]|uniref:nucleotide sugar dehydrogenase n=1 Tax=Bacillus TaxID=1386 RepID=UPI00054FDB64|nr:nucleotide sugar dehydrogenase [Bacillus sp. UNC322MFChir4.1]
MNLIDKIDTKSAKIGVIGLGYVGLPLAIAFAKSEFDVIGIDNNIQKVDQLNNGDSSIEEIDKSILKELVDRGKFQATSIYHKIKDLDVIIICVPTPLDENLQPDISCIVSVIEKLKSFLKKDCLIILESTTYPGTTEEILNTSLVQQGFTTGVDVYICFSPERIDPGNKKYNLYNTTKVIGGITKNCLELGKRLYSNIVKDIFPVSSPRVAEMSKLLENTFRSINIAFINEMAIMCEKLDINIWEVIKAAETKPFGFMPFYPGPGIGGHCIPLDPMYLSWKARGANFFSRFIETAQEVNKSMPQYVVKKIGEILNIDKKCLNGAKILLLGMSYKPNVGDCRESPSLEVYHLLRNFGAEVWVNEPYASTIQDKEGKEIFNISLHYEQLNEYDCIVLMTPHTIYNPFLISKYAKKILDTKNVTDGIDGNNIFMIGKPIKKCEKTELLTS